MPHTTQIELEQKGCIFHNLGIQNANGLVSTQPNSALGRKDWRPPVTFANLQQKKYEVNNPKVSSPEMWLASKLDLGDDDGGYGLTPTYNMGISLCRDALC